MYYKGSFKGIYRGLGLRVLGFKVYYQGSFKGSIGV